MTSLCAVFYVSLFHYLASSLPPLNKPRSSITKIVLRKLTCALQFSGEDIKVLHIPLQGDFKLC